MIRILADSTCDLSKELLDRYQIEILPLHVIMDDTSYDDGVNVTPQDIYAWSDRTKTTPKTSACSPAEAVDFFRKYIDAGDEILFFPIGSTLSTTVNVLHLAAEEVAPDKITIVDSKNLSSAIGLLMLEAAELVKQGKSREEVAKIVEAYVPYVRGSFVIDTLVFLYRGGRCNSLAALVGTVLKIHPRIEVVDGKLQSGTRYRGKLSHATMQYVKDMEPHLLNARKDRAFITFSAGTDPEVVKQVHDYLDSLHHFKEIFETDAGSVIASHCGPGTLGVLFIENES